MSEKQKDIGALWLNESKSGTKYMSGSIEIDGVKHKIVVFKNNYKEQEKHPDYKIYLSTPMGTQDQPAHKVPESMQAETFEDDIPF